MFTFRAFTIPTHVEITSDLATALEGAEIVLSVMPSHHVRALYEQMLPYLQESMSVRQRDKGSGKRDTIADFGGDPGGHWTRFDPRWR